MGETKHTAGHLTGWTFRRIDERDERPDGFGYVSDAEGRDILHVGETSLSESANVAVGALAAAAPDMLAALESIVLSEMCKPEVFKTAALSVSIGKVRAAISKALGA